MGAQLQYRTYSAAEQAQQEGSGDFAKGLYGMPGSDVFPPKQWQGTLQNIYAKTEAGKCSFVVEATIGSDAWTQYGAPASVWSRIDVASSNMTMEMVFLNKTRTRLPESMLLQFLPV